MKILNIETCDVNRKSTLKFEDVKRKDFKPSIATSSMPKGFDTQLLCLMIIKLYAWLHTITHCSDFSIFCLLQEAWWLAEKKCENLKYGPNLRLKNSFCVSTFQN